MGIHGEYTAMNFTEILLKQEVALCGLHAEVPMMGGKFDLCVFLVVNNFNLFQALTLAGSATPQRRVK